MITGWALGHLDTMIKECIAGLPVWSYHLDTVSNWITYMTSYLYDMDWLVPFSDGVIPLSAMMFLVVGTLTAIKTAVFIANLVRGSGA